MATQWQHSLSAPNLWSHLFLTESYEAGSFFITVIITPLIFQVRQPRLTGIQLLSESFMIQNKCRSLCLKILSYHISIHSPLSDGTRPCRERGSQYSLLWPIHEHEAAAPKDIKDQLRFSAILGEINLIWNFKGNVLIGVKLYQVNFQISLNKELKLSKTVVMRLSSQERRKEDACMEGNWVTITGIVSLARASGKSSLPSHPVDTYCLWHPKVSWACSSNYWN